ncbi:MAG: MBL fold metallo-hydrolase [Solirubrobacteraceae bacterium]|nr:MBL fold metallo-hydrolase [Solirubrobacteraceae bacterium]
MSDDADALLARAAEAGIHRLDLPTPFAVGRVNTYLIEDDPLTLVDAGPNSGKALDELEQKLAARGHRIEDLELLVITHQHMDHLGLTGILQRRSGAEVAAYESLVEWAPNFRDSMEAEDAYAEELMARHGTPEELRLALRAVASGFRGWGGAVTITRPLRAGTTLDLRDRTLEISHRPGHSPSDTIFHDRERKILLSADHLIQRISSIALLTPEPEDLRPAERPRPLVRYMDSLRQTRDMTDVELVLTGHGDPVTEPVELIDGRFVMYAKRADKFHGMLVKHGPQSAYEIAQRTWGNVAVTQAFLTLSEVLGHMDLLLDAGRVVEADDGQVIRYRAV